jgi:protein SCO1/2
MRRQAVLAAVGLCALAASGPGRAAAPSAYELGLDFVDDAGRARSLAEWQGKPVVLAMAYGACKRICSTTLRRLESLHEAATRKGVPLEFVVVSLDPAEDTPRDWAEYRRWRGLQAAPWSFLVGSPRATRRLADFLGVRYWGYDGHVLHDYRIVRLSPQGRIATALRWADDDVERLL